VDTLPDDKLTEIEGLKALLLGGVEKLQEAVPLKIVSHDELAKATSVQLKARTAAVMAAEARDELLAPSKKEATSIRSIWNPIVKAYELLDERIKTIASAFVTEEERKKEVERRAAIAAEEEARKSRLAAQEKLRAAETEAEKKAATTEAAQATRTLAAAKMATAATQVPLAGMRVDGGTVSAPQDWSIQLLDIEAVPARFIVKTLNIDALKLALNTGLNPDDVPGIKAEKVWTAEARRR
jgi:hypothetical protein